jgi:MoxR-like ATPase
MMNDATARYPAASYSYARTYFDPVPDLVVLDREEAIAGGDRPRESPYHYDEEIILAVNAALAAGRPLLVAGPAGTGKTALAANIAAQLGWSYFAKVITGASEGRDLLWRFDVVRRLRDAHLFRAAAEATSGDSGAEDALSADHYVERGVLWEAFAASQSGQGAVVLIDEIDKADPEVPNSLLEVLGNGRFTVEDTGEPVVLDPAARPLVVITTNDERELSRPFRRRCVTLVLEPPDVDRLMLIAATWGLADGADGDLARFVANEIARMTRMSGDAADGRSRTPNAAEFLDAVRVCAKLGIGTDGPEWQAVKRATLMKDLDVGMTT